MSRNIPTQLLPLLEEDVVFPFFTVSLGFKSETINFWTGYGQLNYQGTLYIGSADILTISDIEETTELAVRGATLSLAGLDSSLISLALQEPYQGRPCSINFGCYTSLNESGQLLKEQTGSAAGYIELEQGGRIDLEGDIAVTNLFSGYMDTMDVTEGVDSSTIALSVVNKLVDLERPKVFSYNQATQVDIDGTDRGFSFVEDLTGKTLYRGSSKKV